MTSLAGQMWVSPPANPQWVACDGKPYYVLEAKQPQRTRAGISEGNRQDFLRRVGWTGRRRGLGPLGWLILMPFDALGGTYKISLADDGSEANLVPNVTTTTTALVGSGQTVIPVTSATGFAVGLPIAANGIPPGASIALIAALNITISAATTGPVANGATVTVTPVGPPTPAKPPNGVK